IRDLIVTGVQTCALPISTHEPLMLLLDDLHWADRASLVLLQFVTREIASSRVLIVGTHREEELNGNQAPAELLPSLRRERTCRQIGRASCRERGGVWGGG